MKIAVVGAVAVNHDAISDQIILQSQCLIDLGHEVTIHVHHSDFDEANIFQHKTPRSLLLDEHIQAADCVIFHFGIYYSLFDAIVALPASQAKLVLFHNTTPIDLAPPAAREVAHMSERQIYNCSFADAVLVNSDENRNQLIKRNINVKIIDIPIIIPLNSTPRIEKPSISDGVFRTTVIGRLVASKNPLDVVEAVSFAAIQNSSTMFDLVFIGSSMFSDEALIRTLKKEVHRTKKYRNLKIVMQLDATKEQKIKRLVDSDLLVMASEHEGFGVPVVEAYQAGCHVVAYDNSNLPSVVAGFGTLVETKNVNQLAEAILNISKSAQLECGGNKEEHLRDLENYVATFTPSRVSEKLQQIILSLKSDRVS